MEQHFSSSVGKQSGNPIPIADRNDRDLLPSSGLTLQSIPDRFTWIDSLHLSHSCFEGQDRLERNRAGLKFTAGTEQAIQSDPHPGKIAAQSRRIEQTTAGQQVDFPTKASPFFQLRNSFIERFALCRCKFSCLGRGDLWRGQVGKNPGYFQMMVLKGREQLFPFLHPLPQPMHSGVQFQVDCHIFSAVL